MTSPPPRGWSKLQAALHAELRAFPVEGKLRHCRTVVTTLTGEQRVEEGPTAPHEGPDPDAQEEYQRKLMAAQKLALVREVAGRDKLPCQVAQGLFIGPIGAARNLKALRKHGITHIVNASPLVPCFFRDNPERAFRYHLVPIFDESSADLLAHVPSANNFIAAGRRAGGVLVHCWAGQSRSAAFVIAYLMSEGLRLEEAWATVRLARPSAHPNAGFLAQLAAYSRALAHGEGNAGEEAVPDLLLE